MARTAAIDLTPKTPAEQTLMALDISAPEEIDLEAIAWTLGARVRYRPLDGCEARILGKGDVAIIAVNSRSPRRRRRFSLAHELGHWKHHRGRILVCRHDDIGLPRENQPATERIADRYAADLLMPWYLFRPLLRPRPKLDFGTVQTLADRFETSITSTAIRIVESRAFPLLLVCHGPNGRKWFTRGRDVPERWFPQQDLDPESFAFGVLFGQAPNDHMPRKIGADAWFDRNEAQRYELYEQSMRIADDEILTLLHITDEHMLEDWDSRMSISARRR